MMRSLDSRNNLGAGITQGIRTMKVVGCVDNVEGVATEGLLEKFRFNKTLVECADRVTCRARKVALCL